MKKYTFLFLLPLVLSGCSVNDPSVKAVDTYEKCVSSGYAVFQKETSFCQTPDGRRFYASLEDRQEGLITNFDQCVEAGNPIVETFPQKCRTAKGREFVQETSGDMLPKNKSQCNNLCGDGKCQHDVCFQQGCHCPENKTNCLVDCEELSIIPIQCLEKIDCPVSYECLDSFCVRSNQM